MFLTGAPVGSLNSLQDSLLQSVWIRREQIRIFETNVNILANGLSLSPDLSKRISELMEDYIDYVVPGTKEFRRQNDQAFVTKTANSLEKITKLLSSTGSGKVKRGQFDEIMRGRGKKK